MGIRERLSGNEAVAIAMKQINPDVVAAFPITPSTEIPQYFSTFVSNGVVDTEFVAVESEHSAMTACIGAEAAGARAMTATSANGLSLMWEMIYIASSLRLPIVMSLVNRAVSGPLNIHNDHSDAMGVRDAGWIMLFSENNQEAYDNMVMAHRIAEHKDVRLPFPASEIAEALSKESIKSIAVLDKSDSVNGAGGPLFEDVTSAMYVNNKHVSTVNYIYGIGGRDTTADDIESVFEDLQKIQKDEKVENPYRYLGLRSKMKGGK